MALTGFQTAGISAMSPEGRLPSDGPAQGERQLSRIGACRFPGAAPEISARCQVRS